MKIYSWNVNGLRAAEKKGFLDWVRTEEPDILCLQEVKADADQLPDTLTHIEGYYVTFNPAQKKGYSGTAIYYRPDVVTPIAITTGLSDPRFNTEGRTIIFETVDFTLLNIYFPNGQKDDDRLAFKMAFYDCFKKDVDNMVANGKKVIVCGDVNTAHTEMDIKNPKTNSKRSGFLPEERRWITNFLKNGWIDTFRHFHPDSITYSWWSYRFNARANDAGWRIDYFFASQNAADLLEDAAIHTDVMGSDHCPISLTIRLKDRK